MAAQLTEPYAREILNMEGATWGPKKVDCFATAPGVDKRIPFSFYGDGATDKWDPGWGEKRDFPTIANKKMDVIMREKSSTSEIVATSPWVLKPEEYLYSGGDYRNGLGATASGANGWADERIAKIYNCNLEMLAHLETARRVAANQMQI